MKHEINKDDAAGAAVSAVAPGFAIFTVVSRDAAAAPTAAASMLISNLHF